MKYCLDPWKRQNTARRHINTIRALVGSVCHDGLRPRGSIWENITPRSFVRSAWMGCVLENRHLFQKPGHWRELNRMQGTRGRGAANRKKKKRNIGKETKKNRRLIGDDRRSGATSWFRHSLLSHTQPIFTASAAWTAVCEKNERLEPRLQFSIAASIER